MTASDDMTGGGSVRSARYGVHLPVLGVPLSASRHLFVELSELGYSDFWSAEADTTDGIVPLALTSCWVPTARIGTAILPAYTRGPALLAQTAATLAEAAPGRFALGIGASSRPNAVKRSLILPDLVMLRVGRAGGAGSLAGLGAGSRRVRRVS